MDTRPPPPTGAARFGLNRVYRTNLRPVIIGSKTFVAFLTDSQSILCSRDSECALVATLVRVQLETVYSSMTLLLQRCTRHLALFR
jgi:hypothetical protein